MVDAHDKKRVPPMLLIAHRGAPALALENTLRSIQIAEGLDADGTEFDVRGTRDGVPVLLHDKTLERMWGLPQPVEAVDFAQVRALRAASPDGVVELIPTFEEVLDGTRATLIIDSKSIPVIPALAESLRRRNAFERVRFIGEPPILEAVRKTVPDARIIMSWARPELPPADLVERIRPFAINLRWDEDSPNTARLFAREGFELWTYTIDDPALARAALEAGVRGIISNDVAAVRDVVRGRA